LFFNFALEYAIRRVQVNQDSLKLNGAHQLLVYADDVNMLGGSLHIIKENAEALIVASKKIGIEVNANETNTWSCFEIRMQKEVEIIKIDNRYFVRVERFKYLGTNLTVKILFSKILRVD
jgi:hypothetical protein